ncbi:TetR family transcriptional regulator [Massilia sp. G4R7]|uniref:TetR family transcriptional regulator n=1 Tax=Massilia phyllostachyos TaxID=2898585 RepID=A0ABS8Q4J7_9BURK|nr:TetR family transcriptional regulator [Massilia phyllostachyos]MCD2516672.1 TetR family transcriptional regulator [Massilia phyllostachyos]
MNRPRGRPARGQGLTAEAILDAALALLDEGGEAALSMRALATRLGVTPMSLYHHVADRAALLAALSERIYGGVLDGAPDDAPAEPALRALLLRYYDAVGRHPALTLAIFAEPAAFAGATLRITAQLEALLAGLTPQFAPWRDILVDHAHGSGLALSAARDAAQAKDLRRRHEEALDLLLGQLRATGKHG